MNAVERHGPRCETIAVKKVPNVRTSQGDEAHRNDVDCSDLSTAVGRDCGLKICNALAHGRVHSEETGRNACRQ